MVIIIERLAVRSCGPVVDEVSVMLEVVVRKYRILHIEWYGVKS